MSSYTIDEDRSPVPMRASVATQYGRGGIYNSGLSDHMVARLAPFQAEADIATDLTSEIAILRSFVSDDLQLLDRAYSMDADSEANAAKRAMAIDYARARVNQSLLEVIAGVDKHARIIASRRGKQEELVVRAIADAVALSLDVAVDDVRADLRQAGVDADDFATSLSRYVMGTFDAKLGGDGAIAGTISSRPAAITAEDILQAMVDSVPAHKEAV